MPGQEPEKRVKITFFVNPEQLRIAEWMLEVRGGNMGDVHRKLWEKGLASELESTLALDEVRKKIDGRTTEPEKD